MFNERTQKLPQEGQSAFISLWNALGLSHQKNTNSQAHQKTGDTRVAGDGLALLDYEVLVRYQSTNRPDYDCCSDNGRRHLRHSIDDECQYRMIGMSHYGRAVLENISASGLGISICRKLGLNTPITILVETDNPRHLPLLIRATVVRDAGMADDSVFRYGCEIERVIDPNL